MATVVAKVVGGEPKNITAGTVGEVKQQLNVPGHTAQVNGEPAEDSQTLSNDDFVTLSPAVKGGI